MMMDPTILQNSARAAGGVAKELEKADGSRAVPVCPSVPGALAHSCPKPEALLVCRVCQAWSYDLRLTYSGRRSAQSARSA